uniref:FTH domain-containing protein n=1 Tax=Caenorhabditis tropicalis TaxID=1561998 RepID=A0A1I7UTG3_9PELO
MRVCRALHDYIHHSAPVARARILKVVVDNDAVYIRFEYNQPDHYCLYAVKFIMLSFHYHKNGCLIVSADDTEKYVKGKDFLSVVCDHLRRYLRWVGTVPQFEIKHEDDWYGYEPEFSFWEKLNIKLFSFMKPSFQLPTFEEIRKKVWETIEECLQSRVRPLRVTELIMNIEEPRIHILNLLNPKPLKTLIIGGSGRCPEFNVRRLKNLEEISISKLGNYEERCVSQPIRDFFNIKFVSLTVETISDEEILEIKRV